jgi:membrane-associated phospholipid phosphatase
MNPQVRDTVWALVVDHTAIFVPAVMSVGAVFWLISQFVESVRSRRRRFLHRRSSIHARVVADRVRGTSRVAPPETMGLRPRSVYLQLSVAFAAAAAYVSIGSIGNYSREGGYVSGFGWLLAIAIAVSAGALYYAAIAFVLFVSYPLVPVRLAPEFARSFLSVDPVEPSTGADRPDWRLTTVTLVTGGAAAALALVVAWSPHVVDDLDRRLAEWTADWSPGRWLGWFEPAGDTRVALALMVVALVVSARCRAVSAGYAAGIVTALAVGMSIRFLVGRPRPPLGGFAGRTDSFPSGHVAMATVAAILLPRVIAATSGKPALVTPLRLSLLPVVVGVGLHVVDRRQHWPSDVVGSVLLGLAIGAAVERTLTTTGAHRGCDGCPWSPNARPARPHGWIPLHPTAAWLIRAAAHVTAAAAGVGLAILSLSFDVPTNPDGGPLGGTIERPVQLGLAALVSIAALVGWRLPAVGAVLIALAATGLGMLAAVEYHPTWAVALTASLMVPAVLMWLSWQHRRRHREIVAVAAVTVVLIGSTWLGARAVYDQFFGPTHPRSAAAALPVERVEWAWVGSLSATSVTVTARLDDAGAAASLRLSTPTGELRAFGPVRAESHGIVRLTAAGLAPDTEYDWQIVVDGRPDTSRGRGEVRTPGTGPYSFRVAVSSCARVGSNGAVFDAIRESDPLLYLLLGDAHYGNLDTTSIGPYLDAYGAMLTRPGQAALYRDVPVSYVWDDHDYGPNDSGAAAPGRSAAREAFRLATPSSPTLAGDAPIQQAFSIGRVRFVMTDGRSERTDSTLLGTAQEQWLIDEIVRSSRTSALVVWANGTPWIGQATPGNDTWAGYAEERRRIADALAAAHVDNLVMVSGDAHMVAIDDGTNSDYSTSRAGGFPVLQAAALDRPGSIKGGPYSEGTFPGGGQFGLLDIDDDGERISVTMSGWTWDRQRLTQRTFVFET